MIYSSKDIINTRCVFPHQQCKHRKDVKTGSTECQNCIAAHLNVGTSGQIKVKCMVATLQKNVEMWRAVQQLWRMRESMEGGEDGER